MCAGGEAPLQEGVAVRRQQLIGRVGDWPLHCLGFEDLAHLAGRMDAARMIVVNVLADILAAAPAGDVQLAQQAIPGVGPFRRFLRNS